MAAVAGYNGTMKLSTNTVNNIMTFDLPFKMEMIDITPFSAATPGTHVFIPGLYGAQIKCNGSWDKGDTQGQLAMETAFFGRTKNSFVFSPDGTHTYTCSCWISDYDIKADAAKGQVTADFTLQMDGGVTLA